MTDNQIERRRNDDSDLKEQAYIDLILKLFGQVEKSVDKIDTEIIGLGTITSGMIDILKSSTTNEEIIDHINNHNKTIKPSQTAIDNIYIKCKDHGSEIGSINTNIGKLTKWVKNMIYVVTVAFGLMATVYFITRSSIDSMVKNEVGKIGIIEGRSKTVDDNTLLLIQEMRQIRKELHK